MTYSGLINWLVMGFITLSVIKVLPPGNPQPADLLIVIAGLILLAKGRLRIGGSEKLLAYLTMYAFAVNSAWALVLQSFNMFIAPTYFAYNLLAFAVLRSFFVDHSNDRPAIFAILLAMAVEILYCFNQGGGPDRSTGTFDNPNGLAYFSICYTAVGLILADRARLTMWLRAALLLAGWVLNLFALSKAGIAAMFFLTAVILAQIRLVYAVSVITAAAAVIFGYLQERIALAILRMDAIGMDKDDSLAGRGYDRILNEIQYVFLGAGEGMYRRHDSVWGGEIHSTFGTLLFCYGVVGLILFLLFLFYLYRTNRFGYFLYVIPVLVYSLTHNGLRNTDFWILLALLASTAWAAKRRPILVPARLTTR